MEQDKLIKQVLIKCQIHAVCALYQDVWIEYDQNLHICNPAIREFEVVM
jgi:hypothetical protein